MYHMPHPLLPNLDENSAIIIHNANIYITILKFGQCFAFHLPSLGNVHILVIKLNDSEIFESFEDIF